MLDLVVYIIRDIFLYVFFICNDWCRNIFIIFVLFVEDIGLLRNLIVKFVNLCYELLFLLWDVCFYLGLEVLSVGSLIVFFIKLIF